MIGFEVIEHGGGRILRIRAIECDTGRRPSVIRAIDLIAERYAADWIIGESDKRFDLLDRRYEIMGYVYGRRQE